MKERHNWKIAEELFQSKTLEEDLKNPNSLTSLGLAYLHGKKFEQEFFDRQGDKLETFMINKDPKEAVNYFKKAADLEDAEAIYHLGMCYLKGEGVEQDSKEAVRLFRKSAEKNNIFARYSLAKCYEAGEGVEQDSKEAISLLGQCEDFEPAKEYLLILKTKLSPKEIVVNPKSTASSKPKPNMKELLSGLEMLERKKLKEDKKNISPDAEKGEQFLNEYRRWQMLYLHPTNPTEFIKSQTNGAMALKQAAEFGNAEAQYALADCHMSGNWGMKKDKVRAKELMLLSAQNGYARAQFVVGQYYIQGKSPFEKDLKQGFNFFKMTEANQDKPTDVAKALPAHLGECYFKGTGIQSDHEIARGYFKKSPTHEKSIKYLKLITPATSTSQTSSSSLMSQDKVVDKTL